MRVGVNLEQCVDLAVSAIDEQTQARFMTAPVAVLRDDLGLKVQAVEHLAESRADGGACDGMSFLEDGVVLYAPTPNSRRENFTLAHELGHWLVEQNEDLLNWLGEQSDAAKMLETLCDRIAQRMLLPEAVLRSVVADSPISARHVLELYEASEASRPACAIALASRLPRLGAVVIVDRASQTVQSASVRPDPEDGWPSVFPWPGQAVPGGHPFGTMQPHQTITGKSFWRTPWGTPAEFYIDAISDERRIIAVFSDVDTWGAERLHVDGPREFDQRPVGEVYCCGQTRTARGYPCATCRQHYCPQCKRCRCDRAADRERVCSSCFITFLPHLLVDGRCEDCR